MEPIERGDIVVFRYPRDPSKSYIKRVIGVAGDRVRIDDGQVFLNDRPIDEDYVPRDYADQRSFPELTVPPDSFFVLGTTATCQTTAATSARSTRASFMAKQFSDTGPWKIGGAR